MPAHEAIRQPHPYAQNRRPRACRESFGCKGAPDCDDQGALKSFSLPFDNTAQPAIGFQESKLGKLPLEVKFSSD